MSLVWAAAVGFLAGSIPFGLLIARAAGRVDPRSAGSGNVGATNVARTGGLHLGVLTLVLDAAKGGLPAWWMGESGGLVAGAAAAFAAVLGHCFSPWLRFRGGKGVATLLGASFGVAWPWGPAVFAALWLPTLALGRWASLASLVAALGLPVAAAIVGAPSVILGALAASGLVVIVQHRSNIGRLRAGTEPRLGRTKETSS